MVKIRGQGVFYVDEEYYSVIHKISFIPGKDGGDGIGVGDSLIRKTLPVCTRLKSIVHSEIRKV